MAINPPPYFPIGLRHAPHHSPFADDPIPYISIGTIYYVHATNGLNTNDGLSPGRPLKTILAAMTKCVANHDDYIIVMDCYQQDTFPIHMSKDAIHVIGIPYTPDGGPMLMDPPNNAPVFTFDNGIEACEIANFSLGGGGPGSTHGAIELIGSGNNMNWIHNCVFGHYWTSGSQDGIRIGGNQFSNIIEDNWFYGDCGPNGKILRHGIYCYSGGQGEYTIRRNYLLGLDTAILLDSPTVIHEFIVDDNKIACGADADGAGIDLGATCLGCLITDNKAHFGDAAMAKNPFRDQAAGGANHWMNNIKGITPQQPL
jgi:hypothetical protein